MAILVSQPLAGRYRIALMILFVSEAARSRYVHATVASPFGSIAAIISVATGFAVPGVTSVVVPKLPPAGR
jgi:hypothetical protein